MHLTGQTVCGPVRTVYICLWRALKCEDDIPLMFTQVYVQVVMCIFKVGSGKAGVQCALGPLYVVVVISIKHTQCHQQLLPAYVCAHRAWIIRDMHNFCPELVPVSVSAKPGVTWQSNVNFLYQPASMYCVMVWIYKAVNLWEQCHPFVFTNRTQARVMWYKVSIRLCLVNAWIWRTEVRINLWQEQ